MFKLIAMLVALFGSTIAIIAIDKKIRRSNGPPGFNETEWGTLLALTLLFNIAALPYHFGKTRGSGLWGFLGF